MAAFIQKSVPHLTKNSLAIEEMRSWAEELAHLFNRNADMQERHQVFSCYERGLEKTIRRDFESRGKVLFCFVLFGLQLSVCLWWLQVPLRDLSDA